MENKVRFEKKRYRDRMKEFMTLFVFTVGAAILSLVVMDLIILPLTIFAVSKKEVFNYIIKDLLINIIIISFVIIIIKKIYNYKNEGFPAIEVIKHFLLKPVNMLGTFVVIFLLTSAIILILYLILNINNYYIYRFMQS